MSRRKRPTTEEEAALFRDTIRGAVPPAAPTQAVPGAAVPAPVPPAPPRHAREPGIDGSTAERLRRGLLEPQARLDLHGMTEAAAHRRLVAFVKGAHAKGIRLLLVVTGKGSTPDAQAPFDMELDRRSRGILKTMAPRWLRERELAPLVADIRHAHRRHGGGGALYVYLRKP